MTTQVTIDVNEYHAVEIDTITYNENEDEGEGTLTSTVYHGPNNIVVLHVWKGKEIVIREVPIRAAD